MLRSITFLLALGASLSQARNPAIEAQCTKVCGNQAKILSRIKGDIIILNDVAGGSSCDPETIEVNGGKATFVSSDGSEFSVTSGRDGCFQPDDGSYQKDMFIAIKSCPSTVLVAECGSDHTAKLILAREKSLDCISAAVEEIEYRFNIEFEPSAAKNCIPDSESDGE